MGLDDVHAVSGEHLESRFCTPVLQRVQDSFPGLSAWTSPSLAHCLEMAALLVV